AAACVGFDSPLHVRWPRLSILALGTSPRARHRRCAARVFLLMRPARWQRFFLLGGLVVGLGLMGLTAANRQKAVPPASADAAQVTQSPPKAPDASAALALLHARRIRCTVGPGAQADWKSGKPVVSQVEWPKGDPMDFDAIDVPRGTARGIGGGGSSNERVVATASGLTFIEQTDEGNLDITTVFTRLVGDEYPVVESRHMAFPGGLLPSQYHGTCRILPSE